MSCLRLSIAFGSTRTPIVCSHLYPDLSPRPVNNTIHTNFASCPSLALYSTHPPTTPPHKNHPIFRPPSPNFSKNQNLFNTTNADNTQMADYPENPGPLPSPYLKNKSDGGKGPLGRPNFCSQNPELVKHLQKMLVTLGYELGTYGPEKDGVDGAFGNLMETAANDFQEKNRDREEPIGHLGV